MEYVKGKELTLEELEVLDNNTKVIVVDCCGDEYYGEKYNDYIYVEGNDNDNIDLVEYENEEEFQENYEDMHIYSVEAIHYTYPEILSMAYNGDIEEGQPFIRLKDKEVFILGSSYATPSYDSILSNLFILVEEKDLYSYGALQEIAKTGTVDDLIHALKVYIERGLNINTDSNIYVLNITDFVEVFANNFKERIANEEIDIHDIIRSLTASFNMDYITPLVKTIAYIINNEDSEV